MAFPAYIRAHTHFFNGGDVESGSPSDQAKSAGLIVLEGEGTTPGLSLHAIFEHAAGAIILKSQSVTCD